MAPFVPPHHDPKLIAEYRKFDEERGKTLGYASSKLAFLVFSVVTFGLGGVCVGMMGKPKNGGHGFLVGTGYAMLGACFADRYSASMYPGTERAEVESARYHFYKWLDNQNQK